MSANKKYWFKAKKHGWGWYPSTWEGYTVLGIYMTVFLILFYNVDIYSYSAFDTIKDFFPQGFALTLLLLLICFLKGEKPYWR